MPAHMSQQATVIAPTSPVQPTSLGNISPDHAGFKAAQDKLRTKQGEDVTFRGETTRTYAPNVPLDPETKRPYDPMIEPTEITQPELVVRCGVTFRSINRAGIGGEAEISAAGRFDADHILLNAPLESRSDLADMREFNVRGEKYRITSQKPDGVGGVQRILVFGRRV